jgi:hypothetical protein
MCPLAVTGNIETFKYLQFYAGFKDETEKIGSANLEKLYLGKIGSAPLEKLLLHVICF